MYDHSIYRLITFICIYTHVYIHNFLYPKPFFIFVDFSPIQFQSEELHLVLFC